MSKKKAVKSAFCADGASAHAEAIRPQIVEDVQEDFAPLFVGAGPIRRMLLRRQMRREIRDRIAKQVTVDQLF